MRISVNNQVSSGTTGTKSADAAPASAAPQAESRALTVLEAPVMLESTSLHRQAPFLAHLIATKARHPQTRRRGRATPGEAIAAYRAMMALTERHS